MSAIDSGVPEWKRFEVAVAEFLTQLLPNYKVTLDKKTPDPTTGKPRQRDVWIEGRLGDHFGFTVHVSCKRYQRKLNVQDVEQFHSESMRSGANLKILYSYSGFGKQALAVAKDEGITPCSLLDGAATHLPPQLVFTSYLVWPQVRLVVDGKKTYPSRFLNTTWREVFAQKDAENPSRTILDRIVEIWLKRTAAEVDKSRPGSAFPKPWQQSFSLSLAAEPLVPPLPIVVACSWAVFRATATANTVNGSYNFANNDFKGFLLGPRISFGKNAPGEGWELMDACFDTGSVSGNYFLHIFGFDPSQHFTEYFNERKVLETRVR